MYSGTAGMVANVWLSKIPAHRTTGDAVLGWDIFENQWPKMPLIGVLFRPAEPRIGDVSCRLAPNEEHIPALVDSFLRNVHTKNPVLDVQQLVKHARSIAVDGLEWDGWSCLVLMVSALGTISKPFAASPGRGSFSSDHNIRSPETVATLSEMQQAESLFVLACRRLGGLPYSILGAQCYFFAGGKYIHRVNHELLEH
jgi:hypothetical protein